MSDIVLCSVSGIPIYTTTSFFSSPFPLLFFRLLLRILKTLKRRIRQRRKEGRLRYSTGGMRERENERERKPCNLLKQKGNKRNKPSYTMEGKQNINTTPIWQKNGASQQDPCVEFLLLRQVSCQRYGLTGYKTFSLAGSKFQRKG